MHEDRWPHGKVVRVAGLCTVRQRPGTASGVMFMTLEDETGVCNLVVRPSVYQRDRQAAAHQGVILAHGRIERNREVVHIMTCRLQRLDLPENIPHRSRNFR
jgi:error-prone DNA polymerase